MIWVRTLALALLVGLMPTNQASHAGETKANVVFSGGHDTDAKDRGRPVVLIAAALGVEPDVFRQAFRGVTPAKDGKPTKRQAEQNKEALMKALKPHGVTGERLDEVSDHYRYKPGKGNLWKTTPARAYAVVKDGKVKEVVVTNGGSGYSSPPQATIEGLDNVRLKVNVRFDKDLRKNGSIKSIEVE